MTASEPLYGPQWLADYLDLPLATVYAMNSNGTGPRRIRVGKHVRYRKSDVDAWLDARAIEPEPAGRQGVA
jgi:excisionase family DNA binding protein